MTILVTGSAGHLGEALLRSMRADGVHAFGVDIKKSQFTDHIGSIVDRAFVASCMKGVDAVLHTATLHKPHVATHSRQDFVDTNVTGTLNLLEAAADANCRAFVFTSTTSVFGHALEPEDGAPAVWVTEDLTPRPKNIYGMTKLAAENLCELIHRLRGLPTLVLRTSRFFPEEDDRREIRDSYENDNAKTNEYLHRRVEISDAVDAHLLALDKAATLGFGRYIISATPPPFEPDELAELPVDAPRVVARHFPDYAEEFARRGWKMSPAIERVYSNHRALAELDWQPRFDFGSVLERLRAGLEPRSELALAVGSKGYHREAFADGPYPVE